MIIEKTIEIARDPKVVFDYVSDPRNDSSWCPKVLSVVPVGGPIGGPDVRFAVIHRPVPFLPPRRMDYRLIESEPPGRVVWREDDGHDLITVTYIIEASDVGTRFTQRDEAELGAPKVVLPFMRVGIGMDVGRQLKRLRKQLEQG